ncbi:FG-GAP-like repeat-containing protein [Oryzihumus leptocrescens]|uniref:FG-GAP-like repeat-containing protein n=1 Tax=Oryzihumus leptocrescens TaxID=297536 RepID=UPI0031DA922D
MLRQIVATVAAALAAGLGTGAPAEGLSYPARPAQGISRSVAAADDGGGLLMLTFSNDVMRLLSAISTDGATLVPNRGQLPYADPRGRGVRDPSVVRAGDRFMVAYTSPPLRSYLAATTSWALASSVDLDHWHFETDVPMTAIPGVTHVWAPDLFTDDDGAVYSYVAVSTDGARSFQTYVMKALDAGLRRWSAPVLLSGLGANTIDATVRRVGDRYVMFVKDETTKTISRAWATTPMGPFTLDRTGNWMGIAGTPVEGPALVHMPGGGFRLYYDAYTANQLRFVDSSDLDSWSTPHVLAYPWPNARHLGVLALSSQDLTALSSAPPAWPDLTADNVADVLGRDGAGRLWLYPGDGRGGWLARRQVGSGWQGFTAVFGAGDVSGDGRADVLARDGAGRLWLYPGDGRGGWLARRQVGSGWQGFTRVVGGGDLTGDGVPDVLARQANGTLWLYPGDGQGGWQSRRQVGAGWQAFDTFVVVSDLTADGAPDVVARDRAGRLWLYQGDGQGGWLSRRQVGSGWQVFTAIT